MRQDVNAWNRRNHEFDGLVDLDLAIRDPAHVARRRPAFDSGDHLHPNDDGHAASIDELPRMLFDGGPR